MAKKNNEVVLNKYLVLLIVGILCTGIGFAIGKGLTVEDPIEQNQKQNAVKENESLKEKIGQLNQTIISQKNEIATLKNKLSKSQENANSSKEE